MNSNVWKLLFHRVLQWLDELRDSIQRFFVQSATQKKLSQNKHLMCYWPTIHNSIWKICPKLQWQVLSSHFSEILWPACWRMQRKYFNSNLMSMLQYVLIKGLLSRILVYLVWPSSWYLTWESCKKIQCEKKKVFGIVWLNKLLHCCSNAANSTAVLLYFLGSVGDRQSDRVNQKKWHEILHWIYY